MPHHFTRRTVEASAWCKSCNCNTTHAVSGGRLTYCIPCYEKRQTRYAEKQKEPAAKQEGFNFTAA
jgi:hypothetical protein